MIIEEPSDFTEDSLFRSDEPNMQRPCVLASQALLQACDDGACSDGPEEDPCPRTPPDTLDE
eukprot:4342286-Alexandrium_andersonii.AAC.1